MGGMEGMGMDMSSTGMFYPTDSALARIFWYILAGVVFFALLLNGLRAYDVWWRLVTLISTCSSAGFSYRSVHRLTLALGGAHHGLNQSQTLQDRGTPYRSSLPPRLQ